MIRALSLPALALALVLLLAGCGQSTSPALTVNGHEVSQQAIDDELDALAEFARDNPDFPQAAEWLGEGEQTMSAQFTSQVLTERVVAQVVEDEFERRDLEITDDDRREAEERFASQLGNGDPEAGQEVFDEFPEEFREFEITWNAMATVLTEDLQREAAEGEVTDQDVRDFYDENSDQFEQSCVSHILVEEEAAAEDLRQQIEAGADFATVAEANSTDTGTAAEGGDLGCQPAGSYVPEFEEAVAGAEVDELTGPVQTDFGFHLILVTDRRTVPFEEAEPQIRSQLESGAQDPLTQFLQEALRDAEVEVNPRYGEWDGDLQQVVPPEGPESPTTTASVPAAPPPAPSTTGG